MFDEVQTGGGGTGKFWAHEHFNLESAPDLVTFSKKLLIGGFYYNAEYKWEHFYIIFKKETSLF